MERTCGIYQIKNLINNKVYIGSSVNAEMRFYSHRRLLRKGTHDNEHLQNAWNKYGENAFSFDVIELCEESVLREIEQIHMDDKKVLDRSYGYNIAPKANLPPMTEETKLKIGAANKGKKPWITGGHHSEATKEKLRNRSKESYWAYGRKGPLASRYKSTASEETRKKMSLAKLGKYNNHSSKPVRQLCKDGTVVNQFPSAKEAERVTGIESKNIAACLKQKRKRAGGFSWEYA